MKAIEAIIKIEENIGVCKTDLESALTEEAYEYEKQWIAAQELAVSALRDQQPKSELLTLEDVAQAYLKICGGDCVGDDSVGIPCCEFYKWPDWADDEHPRPGECILNPYRQRPKED